MTSDSIVWLVPSRMKKNVFATASVFDPNGVPKMSSAKKALLTLSSSAGVRVEPRIALKLMPVGPRCSFQLRAPRFRTHPSLETRR